jgi:hypothetical protein
MEPAATFKVNHAAGIKEKRTKSNYAAEGALGKPRQRVWPLTGIAQKS